MAATPGVEHYAALSGFNVINGATNSNSGTIYCQLKPWDERKDEIREQVPSIIDVMQKRIAEAGIKNANVVVIQPCSHTGNRSNRRFQFSDRTTQYQ